MKHGVADVLRRGFDNCIANWQLLLLRLAEAVLFAVMVVAAVVVTVLPIIVSLGFQLADLRSPENLEPILNSLIARWTIVFYILGIMFLLILVFVVVHSFLEAGCARVYVDGERLAGPAVQGPRSRYRAFSMAKWWAGAVEGWWAVFWMYNIAWGMAGVIFLAPLLITSLVMFATRGNPAIAAGLGCLGLVVSVLVMVPVMVATGIWTNRAIASWAVRHGNARDTLAAAWVAFKADLGRHLVVSVVLVVVSIAGSMVIGSLGMFTGIAEMMAGENAGSMSMVLLPVRFAAQLLSTAFSAAISGWFLASFCAMANE